MWSMGQSKVSTVPVTFNMTMLLRLCSPLCSPKVHLYVPLFWLVTFLILSEKKVSLESSRGPPSSLGWWDSTSRTFHVIPSPCPAIWKRQIYFSSWATVSSWVLGEGVLKLVYGWKCRGWKELGRERGTSKMSNTFMLTIKKYLLFW